MASAAILSCEEFRTTQRRVEIRQCLHDRFDQWLDTLEEHVKEPQLNTAGLMPEVRVRLWVMADGAPWIWHQVHALCPSAVEFLDDSHCREHLSQVTALPYGDHPEVCVLHRWYWVRLISVMTRSAAEAESRVS